MSQNVEGYYDSFLAELGSQLGKIDTHLAMQTMYYERKFPDVEPSVHLKIHYQDGTDLEKKRNEINSKYGFIISLEGKNTLKVAGLMDLETIRDISVDGQIVKISGSASCASY